MCASLKILIVFGSEGLSMMSPVRLGLKYLDIKTLSRESLDVKRFGVKMYAPWHKTMSTA
jgi:hypothetical protein